MTTEQRDYLNRRIQQLRSKMLSVGPWRQAGIYCTIKDMKDQLKKDEWRCGDSA